MKLALRAAAESYTIGCIWRSRKLLLSTEAELHRGWAKMVLSRISRIDVAKAIAVNRRIVVESVRTVEDIGEIALARLGCGRRPTPPAQGHRA